MESIQNSFWSKKEKCCFCQSLLLVEENDINYHYLKDNDEKYEFQCLICGNNNDISSEKLNLKVKLLAMKRYLLKLM